MELTRPLHQVAIFLALSCLIGFGSNLVRTNSIPWLAQELVLAESIDTDSNKPVLTAISLDQAKSFFDDGILFLDARDEGYYEAGHIKGAMRNLFLFELIFKIEEELWPSMKTFIMFLGKLPEYPKSAMHNIQPDLYCLKELYKIYNEEDETGSNNKSN